MTLYGFGTATIDFRITTAELGPEYRAKLLARTTRSFGGGAVANALHQAALLGARAEWLGRLGRDALGSMIVADLASHRVGTTCVRYAEEALSPFNVAVYAGDAERRVGGYLLPNCLADITDADLDAWVAAMSPDDWCLVEVGEIPLPVVLEFCRRVKHRAQPPARTGADRWPTLVLDVDLDPIAQCIGGTPALFAQLLRAVDYVLPNRDAMGALYPGLDAAELTRAISSECARPVVTTAGVEGAYCVNVDDVESGERRGRPGEVVHVPAVRVAAVDTVGAGDAFHGGFVWSLMEGCTLEAAVRFASRCGAAACTAFGARTGMADHEALSRMAVGQSGW